MKQQTGLNRLCKQFFIEISKYELESFELYFKEVEDKWFNIQTYNDESTIDHPDYCVWEQLYWAVCSEIIVFRKFYE